MRWSYLLIVLILIGSIVVYSSLQVFPDRPYIPVCHFRVPVDENILGRGAARLYFTYDPDTNVVLVAYAGYMMTPPDYEFEGYSRLVAFDGGTGQVLGVLDGPGLFLTLSRDVNRLEYGTYDVATDRFCTVFSNKCVTGVSETARQSFSSAVQSQYGASVFGFVRLADLFVYLPGEDRVFLPYFAYAARQSVGGSQTDLFFGLGVLSVDLESGSASVVSQRVYFVQAGEQVATLGDRVFFDVSASDDGLFAYGGVSYVAMPPISAPVASVARVKVDPSTGQIVDDYIGTLFISSPSRCVLAGLGGTEYLVNRSSDDNAFHFYRLYSGEEWVYPVSWFGEGNVDMFPGTGAVVVVSPMPSADSPTHYRVQVYVFDGVEMNYVRVADLNTMEYNVTFPDVFVSRDGVLSFSEVVSPQMGQELPGVWALYDGNLDAYLFLPGVISLAVPDLNQYFKYPDLPGIPEGGVVFASCSLGQQGGSGAGGGTGGVAGGSVVHVAPSGTVPSGEVVSGAGPVVQQASPLAGKRLNWLWLLVALIVVLYIATRRRGR